MELFRNNFKNIFYFYYISGFLRTKKLTKSPSCFDVCLINCKSAVRFHQIFVASWKTWTLHNSVTGHSLGPSINDIGNYSELLTTCFWYPHPPIPSIKPKYDDIFSWDLHELYMFSMQIVLQWLHKSFRRPCVCNMQQWQQWASSMNGISPFCYVCYTHAKIYVGNRESWNIGGRRTTIHIQRQHKYELGGCVQKRCILLMFSTIFMMT